MKAILQQHKQYLLTGVSYVIPFIACGGILIALSLTYAFRFLPPLPTGGPDMDHLPPLVNDMKIIGGTAFDLFPAVLAGFIAYGMAGRPGLVAGFIGGSIAATKQTIQGHSASAGFLGALVIGLLAGHVVILLKKMSVPKLLRPIMPIIIIPILSSLLVGFVMIVLDQPMAQIMVSMDNFLETMQSGSQIVLALLLGAMIAFDMGGPVNKAAFFFGVAMIQQKNIAVMGACAAAICTPPIGLGLATLLARKFWTEEQREAGLAALGMGLVGITEGAIPFAASDPVRVIPCIMIGSMVSSTIAMLSGVGDPAPHGGPIVLPVIVHPLMFIVAILAGSLTVAVTINLVKTLTDKPVSTPEGN
jgi:PTS system fructose-specific IIC component/fructose-specific PTS system IIC-like component